MEHFGVVMFLRFQQKFVMNRSNAHAYVSAVFFKLSRHDNRIKLHGSSHLSLICSQVAAKWILISDRTWVP